MIEEAKNKTMTKKQKAEQTAKAKEKVRKVMLKNRYGAI